MSTLPNVSPRGHPADAAANSVPRVYGYELLHVLGEGAAGVVYEARKIGEGRPLAIKILHPYLANDEQVRGRFMREAEILASLDGDTVCPVLALGETDDTALPYMVMPKLEGQKLSDLDKTSMSAPYAVELVREICTALETAHRAGIIHRDLKPDNVIVGRGRVTVVDFGMAKIVRGSQDSNQNAELTTNGMIFGTPEYMAPEQARGETADPRCDVYAAGVILYELLCGSVPFQGANALLTLVKVTREQPPPLAARSSRSDMSEALEACVMHAMAKDRNDRYPSARAFRDALVVAMSHPERAAILRPDHYFETEGEAGLTMPLSARMPVAGSSARSLPEGPPPSCKPIHVRPMAAGDDAGDQEQTLDVRAFKRKREIETMPDLRSDAPPPMVPRVTVRRPPSAPPSSSQVRLPSSSPPRITTPQPSAPISAPTPPWVSQPPASSLTGSTPSYASRLPPSLAGPKQPSIQRTALIVWAMLALVAILVGIYLALGNPG